MMKKIYIILVLNFSIFAFSFQTAQAQSLCSDGSGFLQDYNDFGGVSSNMGVRRTEPSADGPHCPHCSPNHPGTDYAIPPGTPIPGPPPECVLSNGQGGGSTLPYQGSSSTSGYGYRAQFDCGTNSAGQRIQIQYAHLQSANSYDPVANTLRTGDSGAGGAHLDYIITVDGTPIDAQCSSGTPSSSVYTYGASSVRHGAICPIEGQVNLCDPAATNALLEHANAARAGVTRGPNMNSTGGGAPPAPPNGTTTVSNPVGTYTPNTTTGTVATDNPGEFGLTPIDGYDRDLDEIQPPYVLPPIALSCNTSTCITADTVMNAGNIGNIYAPFDQIETEFDLITSDGTCLPPIQTGVQVRRQVQRGLFPYADRFCLNKGCSFVLGSGCD